jgi:glucose-1-phosphate cytidylyltransferase
MRFEFPFTNKVLVPINGKPMLHFLLDRYAAQSVFKEFVLCLGNDAEEIKESIQKSESFENERWNNVPVKLLDTGKNATATSRIMQSLKCFKDETFFLSYADIISDLDFNDLISFYNTDQCDIAIALVRARMPYGRVVLGENEKIVNFEEKPLLEDWLNAGYFYINRKIFRNADANMEFESQFLPSLVSNVKTIKGYKHEGFWKGVDTYKDLVDMNIRKNFT